jgi:hypothetical protein
MRLAEALVAWGLARASSGSASALVALARHLSNSAGYTPCSRHQALLAASFVAAVVITVWFAHPRANAPGLPHSLQLRATPRPAVHSPAAATGLPLCP